MLTAISMTLVCAIATSPLLMGTDDLAQLLESPDTAAAVQIIDTRPEEEYDKGHIPDAINLDPVSLSEMRDNIPNVLKPVKDLAGILADKGINPDKQIILYHEMSDPAQLKMATRVFWALEYLSFPYLSVLDGGFAKWKAESREVQSESPKQAESDKAAIKAAIKARDSVFADKDKVDNVSKLPNGILVDARSNDEYCGVSKKPNITRGGHIPNAKNLPADNILENTGTEDTPVYTFLSGAKLAKLLKSSGAVADKNAPIVTYCNTGMSASAAYFGFKLDGYKNVSLYDKSMSEWGNDESLPVKTGKDTEGKE